MALCHSLSPKQDKKFLQPLSLPTLNDAHLTDLSHPFIEPGILKVLITINSFPNNYYQKFKKTLSLHFVTIYNLVLANGRFTK